MPAVAAPLSGTGTTAAQADAALRPVWTATLLLLVVLPVALGGNRPLAWSAASLWAGMLLVWWGSLAAFGRVRVAWHPALYVPVLLVFGVVGWIVITLTGYGAPHPLWADAAAALGQPLAGTVALSREAALVLLMRLGTYAAIFWLALQCARAPGAGTRLLTWLTVANAAYAFYGLANYGNGNATLLWFDRWVYPGDVTGTFVNRNSYATFAAIGLLAALGRALAGYRRLLVGADPDLSPVKLRTRATLRGALPWLLAAAMIAMAWLQSHSRMGAVAGFAGLIVLLGLLLASGRLGRGRWTVAALGLGAAALLALSGGRTLERMEYAGDTDRAPIFALTERIIRDHPWTGIGYGSFERAFQMQRDASFITGSTVAAAHNTYLELAAELGLPVAAALLLCIAWLSALCLKAALGRRTDRMVAVVAAAAATVAAAHSLLDFSLQMPAVAAVFAALLGAGVAQSWPADRPAARA